MIHGIILPIFIFRHALMTGITQLQSITRHLNKKWLNDLRCSLFAHLSNLYLAQTPLCELCKAIGPIEQISLVESLRKS